MPKPKAKNALPGVNPAPPTQDPMQALNKAQTVGPYPPSVYKVGMMPTTKAGIEYDLTPDTSIMDIAYVRYLRDMMVMGLHKKFPAIMDAYNKKMDSMLRHLLNAPPPNSQPEK